MASANKEDDLPSDYDTIVLGTGLSESILAAAFSRIGQKVLHLDKHTYYGAQWSTHTFKSLEEWIQEQKDGSPVPEPDIELVKSLLQEGECLIPIEQNVSSFKNVVDCWYIEEGELVQDSGPIKTTESVENTASNPSSSQVPGSSPIQTEATEHPETTSQITEHCPLEMETIDAKPSDAVEPERASEPTEVTVPKTCDSNNDQTKFQWTRCQIRKLYRKFNLDLCPKLLYCRGALVNLLISSDIAKYCEFKLVTRLLTRRNGELEQVPCSRSDVFASQVINMIEKRMLMKFLEFALNHKEKTEEYADFADKPFLSYLQSRKLTPLVIHYVLNAIAMTESYVSTAEGLAATHKYLMSLGRYGNSSFLWPLFGASEIPQAFCRMCAVFGGVYCLNKAPSHLIVDADSKCVGMVCDGKRLNCTRAVLEASYATEQILPVQGTRWTSRAILLTDRALKSGKEDEITMMYLPRSETGQSTVRLLELPPSSYAAPRGIFVVHLTCESVDSAEDDLKAVINSLFSCQDGDDRPRILWSLFFNQSDSSERSSLRPLVDHVEVLSGPDSSLHYDLPVTQAKEKFDIICPDEEFLPKAPNPEDIIIEGSEPGEGMVETSPSVETAEVIQSDISTEGLVAEGQVTAQVEPASVEAHEAEDIVQLPKLEGEAVEETTNSEQNDCVDSSEAGDKC